MGIIRFYLALCVLSAHSYDTIFPWLNHNSREAVQIFYLISGFYMAHIASKYNSCTQFYLSRFIRIYTPYYFVLFVVIIISILSGIIINYWGALGGYLLQLERNGSSGIFLASFSNITIFFQDWIMFVKDDFGDGLSLTTNFRTSKNPLFHYLLIPQAWSVGVELTFYVFVPLLNKLRSTAIVFVIIISVVSRIVAYKYFNLTNDPWTYRFFPFELAVFSLGMLSNRFYVKIKKLKIYNYIPVCKTTFQYIVGSMVTIVLIIFLKKIALIASLYLTQNFAELLSYTVWALYLPILFIYFENIKYDRYLGELSYPIYLIHLFVIIYLRKLSGVFEIDFGYFGLFSSAITICFAMLLYKYVIIPVDRVRYSMVVNISNYKLLPGRS